MSAAKKKKRSASGVAWTVVAILAVVAVGATVGLFLLGKGGGQPTNSASASAPASVAPSPTETPTPTVGPDQIRSVIAAILATGDASGLVAYSADPVKYVRFGSDAPVANYKPAQLADQLTNSLADQSWKTADPTLVAQWQDSPFREYFPQGAVVMYSDQDHFVSVILDADNKISTVVFGTGASLS